MRFTKMGILAAAFAGVVLSASWAKAGSIDVALGSPVVTSDGAGGFNWTYVLTLGNDESIVANGVTDTLHNNSISGSTGSVVVIYGIGGFKSASYSAVGSTAVGEGSWTGGSLTPPAPASILSDTGTYVPVDDGAGVNVTFTYNGPIYTAPAAGAVLGSFTIDSSLGLASAATLDFGARYIENGSTTLSAENSQAPMGPAAAPVPNAAWMGMTTLLGFGVLGALRKRLQQA